MKVVVWGCGYYGKRILESLVKMDNHEIIGYVDSDKELIGKKIGTFFVHSPGMLKELTIERILVAVNSPIQFRVIRSELVNMGFSGKSIKDIFTDSEYFDLLVDQRIRFVKGYAEWICENNIKGAIAECGVFRGDSAKYINKYFKDRDLYLCDTFEGFQTDNLENEIKNSSEDFRKSKFSDVSFFAETSVDLVLKKMPFAEKVIIKKGYFPDTMNDVNEKFALASLDMDLYIPMLEGLRFFYKRMSKNGCILLHDYFSKDFERVSNAVKDFEKEIGQQLVKIPIGDDCSLAIICV